jgi:hypothetical protein
VAHLDSVAALVDELDDVEAKLRLYNLRDALGIAEAEGYVGKSRVESSTRGEVELTATAC